MKKRGTRGHLRNVLHKLSNLKHDGGKGMLFAEG